MTTRRKNVDIEWDDVKGFTIVLSVVLGCVMFMGFIAGIGMAVIVYAG